MTQALHAAPHPGLAAGPTQFRVPAAGILLIVQKESIQISRDLIGRANISCHEIFDGFWFAKKSGFGEIQ